MATHPAATQDHVEPAEAEELHEHPSPRQYVMVAVILAIITAAEVAIYYVEAIAGGSLLIPLLIAFSVVKFVMVALWFMHLRFDSHIFRRFFITGIVLGFIIFGVVLWFFFTHGGAAPSAS
ncbi:MAG: cytochrome C oxidase subunit IV family protein [Actinomycetota bacterium]|nr:cytochrome C oxidase subunit IV family protein [Actinomycetota bacterium]